VTLRRANLGAVGAVLVAIPHAPGVVVVIFGMLRVQGVMEPLDAVSLRGRGRGGDLHEWDVGVAAGVRRVRPVAALGEVVMAARIRSQSTEDVLVGYGIECLSEQ